MTGPGRARAGVEEERHALGAEVGLPEVLADGVDRRVGVDVADPLDVDDLSRSRALSV